MTRRLFGTDGIRGRAGKTPLTVEEIVVLGRALAEHFQTKHARPKFVVGRDTRQSGGMLFGALSAGLCAAGANVVDMGVAPTPAVAFWTREVGADAGVVISASHNPFQDNGIKLFAGDGFKLSDDDELRIESRLESKHHSALDQATSSLELGSAIGQTVGGQEGLRAYLAHLAATVQNPSSFRGLCVVIDAAHGAAHQVCRTLFESLGVRVMGLGMSPDGTNINRGVGALHPGALCARVVEVGADLGVALDGDADRAILVDEKGGLCDGDICLALMAQTMRAADRLPLGVVVATQMSNLGLQRFLETRGMRLLRTAVGDRYVVAAMRAGGHPLGGEQSGHLIQLQQSTTGDGLLTALSILELMSLSGRPLSELAQPVTLYPQVLLNVPLARKEPLESFPRVGEVMRAVEAELGDDGRLFVRFSGTEPLVRVMIEGTEQGHITRLAQMVVDEIANALA